jgi:hypothetical protein
MCLHMPQTNVMSRRCLLHEYKSFYQIIQTYIVDPLENKKQFITKLKNLLLDQSFYSVNEFLNYSHDSVENIVE